MTPDEILKEMAKAHNEARNNTVVPVPENLKNPVTAREIESKECKVLVVENPKDLPAIGGQIDALIYVTKSGDSHVSSLVQNQTTIQINRYKIDDIIRLAKVLQTQKIKQKLDQDMEAQVDHAALAKDLLNPPENDGSIQVLEGNEHVTLDMFSGNNAQSIRDAIHHIEVNQLQEVAPWSIVWNLWKCLQEVGNGSDQT